jgi:hypothetical protein
MKVTFLICRAHDYKDCGEAVALFFSSLCKLQNSYQFFNKNMYLQWTKGKRREKSDSAMKKKERSK